MTKRTKRLVPRRMLADYINVYGGVDRWSMGELYSNHTGSIKRGEILPETKLDSSVLGTPRGKADARAYEERTATLPLVDKGIAQRLSEIKTWNYFRVDTNLTLHFKMREWVFLKTTTKGLIFSSVYTSKDDALAAHYALKIWWAGES